MPDPGRLDDHVVHLAAEAELAEGNSCFFVIASSNAVLGQTEFTCVLRTKLSILKQGIRVCAYQRNLAHLTSQIFWFSSKSW